MNRECEAGCRQAPMIKTFEYGHLRRLTPVPHERGDVRLCSHGTIWYCEGQYGAGSFRYSGVWSILSPVWNPIKYRRAVWKLSTVTAGSLHRVSA